VNWIEDATTDLSNVAVTAAMLVLTPVAFDTGTVETTDGGTISMFCVLKITSTQ
jgi:hypothetical protein